MGLRAEVSISATTRELRSYREEVKHALNDSWHLSVEQTNCIRTAKRTRLDGRTYKWQVCA